MAPITATDLGKKIGANGLGGKTGCVDSLPPAVVVSIALDIECIRFLLAGVGKAGRFNNPERQRGIPIAKRKVWAAPNLLRDHMDLSLRSRWKSHSAVMSRTVNTGHGAEQTSL